MLSSVTPTARPAAVRPAEFRLMISMVRRVIGLGARVLFCLLFLLPSQAEAQGGASSPDSVMIIPGPDYAAGGFHRAFWGDHYRDTWTKEVRVAVLDLRSFAGGLTPISAGGGFQTKSLWLRGADGKTYAFRSVYKNAEPLVPPIFRNTYVEHLFQDQMSSQYPYAPLVVEPLLRAVGVLQPEFNLYVLPDDPGLGEFRADFAGVLGTLAERPVDTDLVAFLGAREVIDGFEVVKRVQAEPSMRVRSQPYLMARLIDIVTGDFDRHADQWRWVDLPSDATPGWRPIPSDRDQAFARLDGLVLRVGRQRSPMLTSFRDQYDDMSRFHYQARFIDRLFLAELERSTWDSTAAILVAALTDDVIQAALTRPPVEAQAVHGPFIESALKARRDALPQAASDFYGLLAREAYVHASDVPDQVEVTGAGAGVEIVIREGSDSAEPYYHRTFRANETKEIRLYLHAGNDRAVIRAEGKLPVRVRIIGGEGDDEFHFASKTGNVHLYDQHGTNSVTGTGGGGINGRSYTEVPLVPESGSSAPPRHWGRFGYSVATAGYNPDVGLILAGSYTWFDYGFRKDPYASRLMLSGAISTELKGAAVVDAEFRFENSPLLLGLVGRATSLDIVHFYGVGNDALVDSGADFSSDFFKVENTRIEGSVTLRSDYDGIVDVGLGVVGGYSITKDDPNTLLGQVSIYGDDKFAYLGAVVRFDLMTRKPGILVEKANQARAGLRLRGYGFPALADVEEAYGWLDVVGTAALPLGVRRWEVGFRAGGRKIWGDAPWFQLAYIGGDESLRGWAAQRFAGNASLYGSAELRLDLFNYHIVFPSTFGILGLYDAGRVWVDNNTPGGWHTGYGGGIWLGLRGTRSVVSVVYATSDEDNGVYINIGFPF